MKNDRPDVEAALAEIVLTMRAQVAAAVAAARVGVRTDDERAAYDIRATLNRLVEDAVEAFGKECEKFCEDLSRSHSHWPNSVHAVIATIQYEIRARAGGGDA